MCALAHICLAAKGVPVTHSPIRFIMIAVLCAVFAMPGIVPCAHGQDEEYDDEWTEPELELGDWSDEETLALLTIASLSVTVINLEYVWKGDGRTGAGLLAMAFGGASMAFGLEHDRSLVLAAGTAALVVGLASLANSMTQHAPAPSGVTAEPFVGKIAGDTHAGFVARFRY
jgi:hypothetical protein